MTKALALRSIAAAAVLASGVACTVHQTEPPALTGPSELALTLRVNPTPDTINQDGASQSSIRITAIGPGGQPLSGVPIRLDMSVDGVPQDFGTLSARNVVTGNDGIALAIFTAPPAPPIGTTGTCRGLAGTCVTIVATATGANFVTATPQTATIRLVPTGVILPPAASPTPSFVFAPSNGTVGSVIAFDASASCPEAAASGGGCVPSSHVITSFAWSFGDGASGSGKTVSHTYDKAGTFNVTLTVTNDRGLSASKSAQITIGAGTPPTAAFVFGPTPVTAKANTFFDGSNSKASSGRTIQAFRWNWGDGDPLEVHGGPLADHDFAAPGTYQVVLTVIDDIGQEGSTSQSVTVVSGAPTAAFTATETDNTLNTVRVDASASTAVGNATITKYTVDWGDGFTTESSNAVQTHNYLTDGSKTITLTVTDSLGRQGRATNTITVQ